LDAALVVGETRPTTLLFAEDEDEDEPEDEDEDEDEDDDDDAHLTSILWLTRLVDGSLEVTSTWSDGTTRSTPIGEIDFNKIATSTSSSRTARRGQGHAHGSVTEITRDVHLKQMDGRAPSTRKTRVQLNSVHRRAHVEESVVYEVEEQAPAQAGAVFPCGTQAREEVAHGHA